MPSLATPSKVKANVSLKIDFEKKEQLRQIAKKHKRSVHYIMLDMINKGIEQAKEEERVLAAYDEIMRDPSIAITGTELKARVMAQLDEFLSTSGK